jgi:hypothetical protein
MALSGSLKDFDLSYIYQIVAHEGKTGKLTLTGVDTTGTVVFKQGLVVSAAVGAKTIPTMLTRYLIEIRGYPAAEVNEIHRLYGASLRRLSAEYTTKQYLTEEELSQIVTMGIEDFACSLSLWEDGTYNFEVLPEVDGYQAGAIAVAYESITMEAARRADEYRRIRESIGPTTVFIKSDVPYVNEGGPVSPFEDLVEYLYAGIDGTSPVDYLCRNPFASDYRIYEALNVLLEEGRIAPLSEKLSRSINEALRREKGRGQIASVGSDAALSALATAAVVLAVLFMSVILLRGHFLADQVRQARELREAVPRAWATTNTDIALLWYRARHGVDSPAAELLIDEGLVTRRDVGAAHPATQKGDESM